MPLTIDWESVAKAAMSVAVAEMTALNPIAGLVVKWASDTGFAIYDQQKVLDKADPVAAAQLAGDKVADLVEALRFHGS
jgi:hypothetical protein